MNESIQPPQSAQPPVVKIHTKCVVCRESMWISHEYGERIRIRCTCGHCIVIDRKHLMDTHTI
jgi:hypothetical protein